MSGILDTCISPCDSHQISNHVILVEQITSLLPSCVSLRTNILSALASEELQAKVWGCIRVNTETKHSSCQANATSMHQQLMSATIAMLLTLDLSAQSAGPRLPFAVTTALINKLRRTSHISVQCSHSFATAEPSTVSFFQQKNTPYTGQHLQDWRGRLKSELESQGHYQQDSVIRSVAQICQDLENRCDTVEEPLRREKERSQELESRVAELNARVASLEVEVTDDRFLLEGLEDERDNLAAKFKNLEAEYQEAIRKADDTLSKIREDFNATEMELRSTILTHEENARAQQKETEDRNGILCDLREDLEIIRDQHATLSEQHDNLQHRLQDTEQKLSGEYEINRTRSEEVAVLKDRNVELEFQLQGTEADLDTTASRLSDLHVSHQELIQSSEEAYQLLETKYTNDMNAAAAKAKEDTDSLEAQLRDAMQRNQRVEEAHDKTRQDLHVVQASIPPLENRIQELNDLCSEQEEELQELEELRAMRRNLRAELGVASQHPLAIRSASASKAQEDTAERAPRVPREHRRRKSTIQTLQGAPKTTRSTQGITSTAMENIANASFASSDSHSSQNGSTPKRAKPRPSFKVPSTQTPYTQKPVLSTRSVSKKASPSKRSALRQLSPNRRHTTVGFAASENEEDRGNEMRSVRKRRGSLQGISEADFDMEDFLAGTPLTPGFTAGTGRIPDEDDATTTEL